MRKKDDDPTFHNLSFEQKHAPEKKIHVTGNNFHISTEYGTVNLPVNSQPVHVSDMKKRLRAALTMLSRELEGNEQIHTDE